MPRNHGPTVTLLAAMSADGITAAMTMTGATECQVWALPVLVVAQDAFSQVHDGDDLEAGVAGDLILRRPHSDSPALTNAKCRVGRGAE